MRPIYFNEFNLNFGDSYFLPIVSGVLAAHLRSVPHLAAAYQPRLLCLREPVGDIFKLYQQPDVACFSASLWNEQLCLALARRVKAKWPNCLIIFGGPQVPHHPEAYLGEHTFIDLALRGEGERQLEAILSRRLQGEGFEDLPGVSYRKRDGSIQVPTEVPLLERDLDVFASPYLDGTFDLVLAEAARRQPELRPKAIVESTRGCPYLCAYCDWGKGGLSRAYRYHSVERFQAELSWCARNRVEFVFCADSNFGSQERDYDLAAFVAELKKNTGYPEKFATSYEKKSGPEVAKIAVLLNESDLTKGMSLSLQTTSPAALAAIRRRNLDPAFFRDMQIKMSQAGVPVFTELIIGLPGETRESWLDGLGRVMESGLSNQILIYHCQLYRNSDMNAPEFRREHQIETRRIEWHPIHCAQLAGDVTEYDDIIVATRTMSRADWLEMTLAAWAVKALFSLKAFFYLFLYLRAEYGLGGRECLEIFLESSNFPPDSAWNMILGHFRRRAEAALSGRGPGLIWPDYGDIYWVEEEAAIFSLSRDWPGFYQTVFQAVGDHLQRRGADWSPEELREVLDCQEMLMPRAEAPAERRQAFSRDWPGYFEAVITDSPPPPPQKTEVLIRPRRFHGDLKAFAHQVVWFGRKNNKIVEPAVERHTV